jgi:hypothetical protein
MTTHTASTASTVASRPVGRHQPEGSNRGARRPIRPSNRCSRIRLSRTANTAPAIAASFTGWGTDWYRVSAVICTDSPVTGSRFSSIPV